MSNLIHRVSIPRRLILASLAAYWLAPTPLAVAQQVAATIGGRPILIPVPNGFREVADDPDGFHTKQWNRAHMHAVFAIADEYEALLQGAAPNLPNFAFAYTPVHALNQPLSSLEFDSGRKVLRQRFENSIRESNSLGLSYGSGSESQPPTLILPESDQLRPNRAHVLSIIEDKQGCFSFLAISSVQPGIVESSAPMLLLNVSAFSVVNERLLVLGVSCIFKSPADVAVLIGRSQGWVQALYRSNS
ncbi:hypothetical protein DFR39_101190 [Roseateles asaccharophilus]|uniref:Uncharacterized protein n=2 Tax=Roseateles asaccharophilus TaxID=582607 RepID=A0A4V3CK63_9BURK|nr:hypothetical protein DFR39_101190 [Roseateles asaccharophilus]